MKSNLGGQQIDGGRYILREQLGAGGMGSVWMARAARMDTDVVIKFPHEVMLSEDGFKERFQNEIRAMINLSQRHSSIVNILDVGDHDGLPYAVMQYLSGGSLEDWAEELKSHSGAPIKWKRKLRWVEEMADALDYVHSHSLVHRDVKSQNILFDDAGKAYLADFGIAKVVSENNTMGIARVTMTSQVIGTLGYMSHELLMGERIDGRTDQYALAVTLYQVLSGEFPYPGLTPSAISAQQVAGPAKPLHEICPQFPPSLSAVIAKSLSTDANDRFESCMAFATAVLHCFDRRVTGPNSQPVFDQSAGSDARKPPKQDVVDAEAVSPPGRPQRPSKTDSISSVRAETASAKSPPRDDRTIPPSRPKTPPARQDFYPPPPARGPAPASGPPPAPRSMPARPTPPARNPARPPSRPSSQSQERRIECPWCWHRFLPSDILWVAEHPDLHGDIKLRDEQQRFVPEIYTADCRAVDPMGSVCHRTACPRCHLVVPREFIDFEPIFLSVVGTPGSGKSCFLTAMSWQLRNALPIHFRYAFGDADMEMNQPIIENEQELFMNHSDDLVRLSKTDVAGDGYKQVLFGGHETTYLQPLVFSLRPSPNHPNYHASRSISYAVSIYDNAGEHFLPGKDRSDSPVTRHLARSDAVIFVFDPSQHSRFRQKCAENTTDPQFSAAVRTTRQETVLIEAMNRIRQHGDLSLHEKYEKPLVVLVNKYDAWASRFDGKRLPDPWSTVQPDYPASLDAGKIERTSSRIRDVMMKMCPEVVAAAENFSSHVTYIPVSAFGRRVEESNGVSGVRPSQLRPMWVEVPMLYILSQIRRGVIPKI